MTEVTIDQNHRHALTIPQEDIDAGEAKDYDIQGEANHGHTVSLTEADFESLKGDADIEKQAAAEFRHDHTVRIVSL